MADQYRRMKTGVVERGAEGDYTWSGVYLFPDGVSVPATLAAHSDEILLGDVRAWETVQIFDESAYTWRLATK